MIRRELPALLGLAPAAAPGREDDGAGVEVVVAAAGAPALLRRLERCEGRAREGGDRRGLGRGPGGGEGRGGEGGDRGGRARVPDPLVDRWPRGAAARERPFPRRPAAACEPVAAVLAGELDPELLEPGDRSRGLAGQQLHEPAV